MKLKTRNYTSEPGITADYFSVRQFLITLGDTEYSYARWDWMITHPALDEVNLAKIRLWEDETGIVGMVTYDLSVGIVYCLTLPSYHYLKKDMLIYAEKHLTNASLLHVVIPNQDRAFQQLAYELGYRATGDVEHDACFYLDRVEDEGKLPQGFKVVSMEDVYDLYQYKRVLWRGFNHELNGEGAFSFTELIKDEAEKEMARANVDLSLKLAVVNEAGAFVAYCGLWYDQDADFAVIEPLATDPAYRNKGLAKAVVLEGIKRVKEKGAQYVLVGSNQVFYYKIGMFPYREAALWKKSVNKEG